MGTLFFNATTFRALQTGLDSPSYDRLVWRPDALGSACFLVSGCLAFGISAVTSYVVPSTGSEVSLAMVNLCTALGALCFLVGALLLLPAPRGRPTRMIVGALVLNGHPDMDQDGAFEEWWT